MGAGCAASAARAPNRPARNLERDPVRADHWLPMAGVAEGLSAEEHRARLFRRLALRWHADPPASCALRRSPRACGQEAGGHDRNRRQSERQKYRKRGANIDPSGYDAGKKTKGKKRHIAVDTLGLMVGLCVSPADIQDRDMIAPLLKVARRMFPSLARAIADGGYQGAATAVAVRAEARIPLEIVKRSDTAKGFTVLPKRWIVERTFGWFGRCRRLAKDFENLSRSHAAFVILAMIRIMLQRIVRLSQTS